jgi:peptidoglycan/xylan/chitin deacetylase (PgdA/CDA1 family)
VNGNVADVRESIFELLDRAAYWLDCVWSVLLAAKEKQQPHAVTVYFHAVLQSAGDRLLDPQEGMTSDFLLKFIRAMKSAGYTFVTPDSLLDSHRPSGNLALLTSDDGYRSVEGLLPVLRREAVPLAVFLTTEYSRRDGICWWDQAYIAGVSTSGTRSLLKHGVTSRTTRDEALRRLGIDPYATAFSESHRLLSPSDLGRLASDPHLCFGNHTRNHLSLPLLEEAEVRDEVEGARQDIEGWTGRKVRHFAFPYGDHAGKVVEIVKDCGYGTLFTTEPGILALPSAAGAHGPYVVPRYRLRADRSATWQAKRMGKGITVGARLQARTIRWIKRLVS